MDPESDLADDSQSDAPADDELEAATPAGMRYVAPVADAELVSWIEQVCAQDERALAALYDALVGKVYGLVRRITGQRKSPKTCSGRSGARRPASMPAGDRPAPG